MQEQKQWLRDWCAQNIKFHRGGSVSRHCKYCKAELRISPGSESPDIDTVWEQARRLGNVERIASVLGVIFPPAAARECDVVADLMRFEVLHDDSDAARLCCFLLDCVAKYAPAGGQIESEVSRG
jgi:hypothetical protein